MLLSDSIQCQKQNKYLTSHAKKNDKIEVIFWKNNFIITMQCSGVLNIYSGT